MKAELQNMYILNEENQDLRDELNKYKSITFDERMKAMKEENDSMKIRIGQLLERIHDLEERAHNIDSKANDKEINSVEKNMEYHNAFPTDFGLPRPSTAQTRTTQSFDPLLEQVEAELDLDIQAMLERNKKLLDEMKEDIKDLPES